MMVLAVAASSLILCLFLQSAWAGGCPAGMRPKNNVCMCKSFYFGGYPSEEIKNLCSWRSGREQRKQVKGRDSCNYRGWRVDESGKRVGKDSPSEIACSCDDGWSGERCEIVTCENGGTAAKKKQLVKAKGYICYCGFGFRGDRCELHNCGAGRWNESSGRCHCDRNFSGVICKIPECFNKGRLTLIVKGTGECECTEWFRGVHCQHPRCKGQLQGNKCLCPPTKEGKFCQLKKCTHGQRDGRLLHLSASSTSTDCICPKEQEWWGRLCEKCDRRITTFNGTEFCCLPDTGPTCAKKSSPKGIQAYEYVRGGFIALAIACGILVIGLAVCKFNDCCCFSLNSLPTLIDSEWNPYSTNPRNETHIPLNPISTSTERRVSANSNSGQPASAQNPTSDLPPNYEDLPDAKPPSYHEVVAGAV